MKEWCFAHPWMTFFIIFLLIVQIENILVIINNRIKIREHKDVVNTDKEEI